MTTTIRITPVICVLASAMLVAATPSFAQFSAEDAKCRASVAKAGTRLTKTILKSFAACHKMRNTDESMLDTDCNDTATADLNEKLPGALEKFTTSVTGACPTQSPSSLLYETCPAPCDASVPALADFGDVADCLACVVTTQLEAFSLEAFSEPDPTLAKDVAACHRSITSVGSKLVTAIVKSVSRCQAVAEKNGATSITDCTLTSYDALVADAVADATAMLETKSCSGLSLPNTRLDACDTPDTVAELASCVVEAGNGDAQFLASALLALPDGLVPTTTTSTTTSTTLPAGDPECPAFADVSIYSRDTTQACTGNGDCTLPRTCHSVLGTCTSPTDTDLGWAGYGHDRDTNSGARLRVDLNCQGPAAPGCGTCTVTGVNPEPGNCRCANDTRTICDDPFTTAAECGGNACVCYLGAPTPISAGGSPLCLLQRLSEDVSGSIDVDSGGSSVLANARTLVYLGAGTREPCPTCGGTCTDNPSQVCDRDADCVAGTCTVDPTAGDGLRGGTCTGGANAGLDCDVTANNASLPAFAGAQGGSGYSLDCMVEQGRNVSGAGLAVTMHSKTGVSSLAANVPCGTFLSTEDCPCLVCSAEPSVACNDHSDCAAQQGKCSLGTGLNPPRCNDNADCEGRDAGNCHPGILRCLNALAIVCSTNADCDAVDVGTCTPSTCSEKSTSGSNPAPNSCDDLLCSDLGGGEGECTTGPDVHFCDSVVLANGDGVLACSTNDDCVPSTVGVDAGDCTITKRLECFLDPISASGSADPDFPVAAATYCMPPTSNAGINAVSGLPGPVRTVQQTSLTTFCGSDPDVVYTPGVGGCP